MMKFKLSIALAAPLMIAAAAAADEPAEGISLPETVLGSENVDLAALVLSGATVPAAPVLTGPPAPALIGPAALENRTDFTSPDASIVLIGHARRLSTDPNVGSDWTANDNGAPEVVFVPKGSRRSNR